MNKRRILSPEDNWFNLAANHSGEISAGKTIYYPQKNAFETLPVSCNFIIEKQGEVILFDRLSLGSKELATFRLEQSTASLSDGIHLPLAQYGGHHENDARGIFLGGGAGVWFESNVADFWFSLNGVSHLQLAASFCQGELSEVSCVRQAAENSVPIVEIGYLDTEKTGVPYQILGWTFEGVLQVVDAKLNIVSVPNFRFNPSGKLLDSSQLSLNFEDRYFVSAPRVFEKNIGNAIEAVYIESDCSLYYSRIRYDSTGQFSDFSHGYLRRLQESQRHLFRVRAATIPRQLCELAVR